MKLAIAQNIRDIDGFAEKELNISTQRLMQIAGQAVAAHTASLVPPSSKILILAGKGNNGGDGYAAALELCDNYEVIVADVFSAGQRSESGRFFLSMVKEKGVRMLDNCLADDGVSELLIHEILTADLIIDAIFGIGFEGELSHALRLLADSVNSSCAQVVCVDIPLGVNSDTAEADPHSVRADVTVALSLPKVCHLAYPSKEYVGMVVTDSLGLDSYFDNVMGKSSFEAIDISLAASLIPDRNVLSNKGSFGKALHITGSDQYRGAAHLALEASLRSGVGITAHVGDGNLNAELRLKYPETIFHDCDLSLSNNVVSITEKYSSVLVGSGSSVSEELYNLVQALVRKDGGTLVLDADALNSISKHGSPEIFKNAARKIILTPHPLELSRLCGLSTDYIASHRVPVAVEFARKYGVILLLKGAATVITDGEKTYINTTGSTALSKGGSGDVLAGLIAALAAYADPLESAAVSAYLHGFAGDTLSAELSDFGVTPSDLPAEIGRHIRMILNQTQNKK